MCLYIVDNIYFRYVDMEKRIDNSPNKITLCGKTISVISF